GRADQIKVPTLLIIAGRDQIIPPEHADALYRSINPSLAQKKLFKNADHNNISISDDYQKTLRTFFTTELN
ncbi:MAG: lysophospholipase, partial [Acidiferrobacterales bacterium]|nr:lysophospholipase [Acidiferrobacterales bacterium]